MSKYQKSFSIQIGTIKMGGEHPVTLQSMTNTNTMDVTKTLEQINQLESAGCDIVRVAVPTKDDVFAFEKIVAKSPMPVIADIHFDYSLAIDAILAGAHKIRINPGNIGSKDKLEKVIDKTKEYNIPVRIGINSGSLERPLLKKHGGPTSKALVESAINNVKLIEEMDFDKIVVSLKASDVKTTIEAYREFSKRLNNPLHLGVTEAGTFFRGSVKNAIGIGSLLFDGIGDTIRVSLTGSPLDEIYTGKQILQSLGLRKGVNVISCPTCSRTVINVEELASEVEKKLSGLDKNITVAVMGCNVNGPGEAREADVGIAGGKNKALIFKHGKVIRTVPKEETLKALFDEIK